MFLDYHNLKKLLIGEAINNTTVDEYINCLNNLGLMSVILENLSLEIRTLSSDIIYEVYFNMNSIGFVEKTEKVDDENKQVKLEILKELLINDKNCKNEITNLLVDYNISKLCFMINPSKLSINLSLLETIDNKKKFNDNLYRNYCNVLNEIYYDKTLVGSYVECAYHYSNNSSNDFNDCSREVNKIIPTVSYDELKRIINKMRLENIKLKNQLRKPKDDKSKVKNK